MKLQVSPIAVLERCKSNYQQKQWDAGAFLMYDNKRASEAITTSVPTIANDPTGACLLRAEKNHESNQACMSDYLSATFF